MKFNHVVFDIDGTLLDTEKMVLCSLSDALRRVSGRSVAPEELAFALGIPGEDALKRLQVEPTDRFSEQWDAFAKEYEDTVRIFPGIQKTLEELRHKEVRLGIVTSRTKLEYDRGFVPFELTGYFPVAICADDTPRHKPHGDPMEAYLQKSGANRDKTLYVGDSRYDMECAKAAGVSCALALWGCKSPEGISSDYRIREPKEILGL